MIKRFSKASTKKVLISTDREIGLVFIVLHVCTYYLAFGKFFRMHDIENRDINGYIQDVEHSDSLTEGTAERCMVSNQNKTKEGECKKRYIYIYRRANEESNQKEEE